MSSFGLFGMLFLAPVFFIVSAYLLTKHSKKIPRTSSFIFGLLFACVGIFGLLHTYNLFANDQAFVPLKGAYTFSKADSPIGFIVCTVFGFGLGLAALGYGLRAIYRSLSNQHLHIKTDLSP